MTREKIRDVVIDTDAFNEVDDQFAISYLLSHAEELSTVALYAAPFFNGNSTSPADGMEKSYRELSHILTLAKREDLIPVSFRGSDRYLQDEKTPVSSDAARDLASRAMKYSAENPLTVLAIGAITNVASALLLEPKIAGRLHVIWLGGHAHSYSDTKEFNMHQDIAAARVVMRLAGRMTQIPCNGVTHALTISKQELEHFFLGKNPLADYLAKNTIRAADSYAAGKDWTRPLWDISSVACALNRDENFAKVRTVKTLLPSYEGVYEDTPIDKPMDYVYFIKRDAVFFDLVDRLTKKDAPLS